MTDFIMPRTHYARSGETNIAYQVAGDGPMDLTLVPGSISLSPGSKAKLRVSAARKAYLGPVSLEARNLPAGVIGSKVTIEAGQASAEIELTAQVSAAPSEKADVHVVATIPSVAGFQQASGNFKISIMKKK